MNDCASLREWLSAYLDGEIDTRRREAVEAHLAGCDACRRELASLREVSACLRVWPAPEANPQLSARFAARLAKRTRQKAGYRPFATPWLRAAWATGLTACLALAVFVCLHGLTPREKPDNSPAPVVSQGGNGQPIAKGDTAVGKDDKIVVDVPPAIDKPKDDFSVPPASSRAARHRPARVNIAKLPAPNTAIAVEKYNMKAEEHVIDPALTAVNVLTETPIAPAEDMFVAADDYALETIMSKDEDSNSLPIDAHYEHQPAALAFALLAEAP